MQCRVIQILLLSLLLGLCASLSAQHEHHHDEHVAEGDDLGMVDFQVDCDADVQTDFNRALALMHHMMYVQARSEFAAIKDQSPDCAMAYWGVATTLFQPLWGTRPSEAELQRGRENIERAAELVESEREQVLVESTRAFFDDTGEPEFWDRLHGWIDGMAAAHSAHPDDLDVASLQGLALLTLAQVDDDRHELHDQAEKLLRAVWEQEEAHPGAIHYSIHATDMDGRATNALDMVEIYSEIAPNTAHALHMPSHIYVRLGDWPEVIEWNRRSSKAALNNPVNGSVSHHYIHAIDYLIYAYLQQGNDSMADRAFEESMEKDPHQASFVSAFHFASMPARLAVERRDWESAAAIEPRQPDHLPWDKAHWPEGISWTARGLGAVHSGDLDSARHASDRLAELRDAARSGGEERMGVYVEIDRKILEGWIAHAEGDTEKAVEAVRQAAELETTVEKHPVTPGALMPPREALGDLLMATDQAEKALAAYEASNEIWPGRYNTLLGAARAAAAAGKQDRAEKYYGRLLEMSADSKRDSIAEARAFGG